MLRGKEGCEAKVCDCEEEELKCCTIVDLVGTVDADVLRCDHSFLRAIDAGLLLLLVVLGVIVKVKTIYLRL